MVAQMLIANDANDGPENLLDVAKGVKLVEGAHALTVANMIRKNAAGNHVKQEFGDKCALCFLNGSRLQAG